MTEDDELNKDGDFKMFLIELTVEWIEERKGVLLSREFTLPKLRAKQPLQKHIIRRNKRPIIAEVDNASSQPKSLSQQKQQPSPKSSSTPQSTTSPQTASKQKSLPSPKYVMKPDPKTSTVEVRIHLPDVSDIAPATLDIEAHLLLFHLPDKYDLTLPLKGWTVDTEKGRARFDVGTKVLTVVLEVVRGN
ncbi:hypothetical protein HDV00_003637 [Rhizophlyctis rosea]|nr:hypothetical protein HDV00_003637 [Rhizophlyctis rosea]